MDEEVADCGIGGQAFGVEENDIALVEVFIKSDAGEAWGSKDAERGTDGEDEKGRDPKPSRVAGWGGEDGIGDGLVHERCEVNDKQTSRLRRNGGWRGAFFFWKPGALPGGGEWGEVRLGGAKPVGDLAGVISKNEVGAGAFEGEHLFEDRRFFVDPTGLGGGLEHGVFAADMVSGGGEAELFFDAPDEIEIGEARFDHDDIGTFLDIEGDLSERFSGVGGVHLVGAAVATSWGAFGGLAEGAIECGGKFCGVRENGNFGELGGVKGVADRPDAAVHHVAGSDDIGPGGGVREGGFGE